MTASPGFWRPRAGAGLIDRFVVPAVAIGLLLSVLSYPLWLSLEDVLFRMTIQRAETELRSRRRYRCGWSLLRSSPATVEFTPLEASE
jgi:hypothetical protein